MKYILILLLLTSVGFSNELELNSFEANFSQVVTNDKGNTLEYKGTIKASKPQNMLWSYTSPAKKDIFINSNEVVIIEYDIEQVQRKKLDNKFNFFKILKNAKKDINGVYSAVFKEVKYTIRLKGEKISSIEYSDELDNRTTISFTNQIQNKKINPKVFIPLIPEDFDIIQG